MDEKRPARTKSLHKAVNEGSLESALSIVRGGADINEKDKRGRTPLVRAIKKDHEEIAMMLVEHGADLGGACGNSLLHLATKRGHVRLMAALLDRGMKISSRNWVDSSPLDTAAHYGQDKAFELLLARGSDPNERDSSGRAALHSAASGGKPDIVKMMLGMGVAVDPRTNVSITPLMWGAQSGDPWVIRHLLNHGADPLALDDAGCNALHYAARAERAAEKTSEVAELLLAKGTDRDAGNELGMTALHEAARNSHLAMVTLLLDLGANVNTLDGLGRTPLDHAIRSDFCRRLEQLALLREHGGQRGSNLNMTGDWLNCLSCKVPWSTGCMSCVVRPEGRRTGEAVRRKILLERLGRARDECA